jgi:KipI family sensor histidine kinase inhibitor
MQYKIMSLSDRALTFAVSRPEEAQRIADALRKQAFWQDVVPGLSSVTVFYDPLEVGQEDAVQQLTALGDIEDREVGCEAARSITIHVRYGGAEGPDLKLLSDRLGLPEAEIVRLHTEATYKVAMMGFLPGFAYLTGLPPALTTERLASPRLRVQAGSVGIGGTEAGIYSLSGSGGWPIIGRTDRKLFDPNASEPFLLAPGTMIRFMDASLC